MESKTIADLDLLLEQQFEIDGVVDLGFEKQAQALINEASVADTLAYRTRLMDSQAAINREIKRLKERFDRLDRKIERAVAGLLWKTNGQDYNADLFSIHWRESKSCEVIDPSLVPDTYIRTKIVREIDKSSALADLKVG